MVNEKRKEMHRQIKHKLAEHMERDGVLVIITSKNNEDILTSNTLFIDGLSFREAIKMAMHAIDDTAKNEKSKDDL